MTPVSRKRWLLFMAIYVALLAWIWAMGWLWIHFGHWPAWYVYPMGTLLWLACGALFWRITKGARNTEDE